MRSFKKYKVLYVMMLPAIAYYILFHYVPMYGAVLAFKDFQLMKGIWNSPWIGMYHFMYAFSDPVFLQVLKNTIIISFYKLIFGFPVPVVFALLLNEVASAKFKKLAQTISYLPHFISWVVMAGIFVSILSIDGFVNSVIKLFGMDPVLFMGNEQYFRLILVLTEIYKSFGWGAIVYFAAISGINGELYEAAIIDGAGRFKRVIYITIPMLAPVMAILLILSMAGILDAGFDQIFNMYSVNVYRVSDIIDTYVYRKGMVEMKYSYATAVGLFKSVVALIMIVTVNQVIKTMGGKEHALW
ncbi:putative aldouronate transport system permease protein [Paenibacillus sp. V4I9]|uniref:ABC transporter permease n=1 Tax=Paenibacillus sp. V4I9 TaxID=3042308 RepID=UPI0027873B55|nr:ABC transporter permease subunit [Paenibacillus sp. V4I9]MDQ0886544.1 putative aldouronate transport system permease protein [Paenibacillus sp. V4I9]